MQGQACIFPSESQGKFLPAVPNRALRIRKLVLALQFLLLLPIASPRLGRFGRIDEIEIHGGDEIDRGLQLGGCDRFSGKTRVATAFPVACPGAQPGRTAWVQNSGLGVAGAAPARRTGTIG